MTDYIFAPFSVCDFVRIGDLLLARPTSRAMLVRLSQCIAYCLERARACREKADAFISSTSQSDFSDLEDRWLRLAASYEFSDRLASGLNDRSAHKRNVRMILYHAGAIQYDADAIACMALAFDEIMKAISVTGTERPESLIVARLIVECAAPGECDADRLCNSVLSLLNAKDQTANRETLLFRSSGGPSARPPRDQDHSDPDTVSTAWLEYGLSGRWLGLVVGLAVFLAVTVLIGIVCRTNDRQAQIDHRLNAGVAPRHNIRERITVQRSP
jgi:hypothetical protein